MKGIYVIECDKYFYIGLTGNLAKRKREHKYRLNNNIHPNPKMQSVFNKGYKLQFKVLEECEDDLLEVREIYWFNKWSVENPEKEALNLKECGSRPTYSYEAKVRISKGKIKKQYNFNQRYSLYDYDTNELLYVGDIFEVSKYSNVDISALTRTKKSFSEVFNTYVYMVENFEFIPLEEQIDITDIY